MNDTTFRRLEAALIVFLLAFLTLMPSAKAGQGSILPSTFHGMTYSVAFSYPDTLQSGENYSISMTMIVLFNNVTVTNINITEITILIVPEQEKPDPHHHDMTRYFIGCQWVSDRSKPLYKVDKTTLGDTRAMDFNDTRLVEWDFFNEETIAQVYVEVEFRVQTQTGYYPLILFAGTGEMPKIQLLPKAEGINKPFYESTAFIIVVFGVISVVGLLAVISYRRTNEDKKRS